MCKRRRKGDSEATPVPSCGMEQAEHLEAVNREFGAFTTALADGPATTRVPTCPEWTVADLAHHIGGFCAFWSHVLCEGTGRPKPPYALPTPGEDLVGWTAEQGSYLLGELRTTPPDATVWTWHETNRSPAFIARRCAHELAVHRFDMQAARDTPHGIEPRLAADGIDELLTVLPNAPRVRRNRRGGLARGQTMHLHGTDDGIEAEWLVTLNPGRVEVSREHAKGDLAVRGSVSDIELLLYGRPPIGPVDRFGDESVLEVWASEVTL